MPLLKLKQFGLVLCCIVSLFMPAFAACVCSHTEVNSDHCHFKRNSSQKSFCSHRQDSAEKSSSETIQPALSESGCCCASQAPRVFAKSETVKIEKQIALTVRPSQIEINTTPRAVSVKTIVFARLFYLSDSFYNISPGRAPPSS